MPVTSTASLKKGSQTVLGAYRGATPAYNALGFYRNFAQLKSLNHGIGPAITFTRASGATYFDVNGVLQTAANDVPRFDHSGGSSLGLLIEEARTNSIRNSTMQGAVAGTTGTPPTNWDITASGSGLTRQIVGTGTEGGLTYIDIRYSGTASGDPIIQIRPETTTGVVASSGQTWTSSAYVRLVGGTSAGVTAFSTVWIERDSGGLSITAATTTFTAPTSAALKTQRITATRTLTEAGTARLTNRIDVSCSNATIDITLRIAAPQLEQGTFPTSYIPTTTAAATRSADVAVVAPVSSFYNQSEGTMFGEWNPIADSLPTGAAQVVLDFNDQTASNVLSLFAIQGAAKASQNVFSAGSNYGRIDAGGAYSGETVKAATAIASADRALSVNGSSSQTSSASVMPVSVTHFNIGSRTNSLYANSHIRKIAYYPKRLTNTLLQQLTT